MNHWYLGTIGFSYKEWLGGFYPPGLSQRDYLLYYSKIFNAVELDTSFHSIPRKAAVLSWNSSTPPDFKICLKTPRVITHEMRLVNTESLMAEFIEAIQPLQEKNGPIIIQLPPNFRYEKYSLLAEFLATLPAGNRYAVEFRHASWYNEKTAQLLMDHQVCWVTIDFPNIPRKIIPTTDFLYFRWIGINGMYHHHSYERADKTDQLKYWLGLLQEVKPAVPIIFGFFNNDYTGFAAGTCKRFKLLAGISDEDHNVPYQERLF
jgi:uncharacterized protein YecE (DUF72 family)